MAKKKTTRKTARGKKPATVGRLRQQIDRLDRQLLELANERAELARQMGEVKREEGAPIVDWQREDQVLSRIVDRSKGPLSERAVAGIFRELVSGSRALQTTLRVAFLGPLYTYSHQAAMTRFGQDVDFIPVASIGAVFEEVRGGQSDFGLVPIENSTDGRIADTLDNFARNPVEICGEVQLRIHHTLLATCKRAEVTVVYSRPQALSQCRNWIGKHLPSARISEVTSTSRAAELAREEKGAAAVAGAAAAAHYGLDVLARNIEDNPSNVTRFSVIGSQCVDRTGDDKTTLMFELAHRAGVLADAIGVFKRNRVSLTWIESFPMTGREGGYLFFVELEGHRNDTRVRRALASLGKKVLRLEVLGSYARMTPEE